MGSPGPSLHPSACSAWQDPLLRVGPSAQCSRFCVCMFFSLALPAECVVGPAWLCLHRGVNAGRRLRWSPVCCGSSSCHPLVSPALCCGGNHKSVVGTQASSLCDGHLPTLSSDSTENFQVVWYHPVPFRINAFFHLKALSKPKSWPSKARGAPKVHLSIPLVS